MALTQIIDSMLLSSETEKRAEQCSSCHHPLVTSEQSPLEQLWTRSQPVSQESHPARSVSCHLPISAEATTQMDLWNTASSSQSGALNDFWISGWTIYISINNFPAKSLCVLLQSHKHHHHFTISKLCIWPLFLLFQYKLSLFMTLLRVSVSARH